DSGSKPECNVEFAKPRVALAPRELAWTIPQPRNAPFDSDVARLSCCLRCSRFCSPLVKLVQRVLAPNAARKRFTCAFNTAHHVIIVGSSFSGFGLSATC